jgi:uroporphyrinogen-III decarboxylase
MGAKEAVNNVLSHKQPEYIPIGMFVIDCDTAAKVIGHETYVRDKIRTQIALWEGRRDEVIQSLKEDSVELFKRLGCLDIAVPDKEAMLVPPKGYLPPKVKKLNDCTFEVEGETVFQCSFLTNDFTIVKSPPVTMKKENYEMEISPSPPDESIFEVYDHFIGQMKDHIFIAGTTGGFHPLLLLGGMADGLALYYENPGLVKAAIAHQIRWQEFNDRFYIREGVDQLFISNDMAMTQGPLMSPEMFREFCLPSMKQRIAQIKKYRDKVILHCCGNTWKYMDMFVESGVDCLQSLQTEAGMDLRSLKEQYGSKLSFWGGVGVEKLIVGTQEDVRNDVRRAMRYGAPNGGFILGPSHSIAYGVKYDNFMSMLDEHDKLKYDF